MTFINVTPHSITLNDGRVFESVGVARVGNTFSDFDSDGVCSVAYGDIEGLPAPQEGTLYIVSALVLSAAKAAGRTDCVAPATGHPACVRDKGFIVSVPGLRPGCITQNKKNDKRRISGHGSSKEYYVRTRDGKSCF